LEILVTSRRSERGPCSVSSGDQPDEVVYAMVKAVAKNFAVFRQLHPTLSTLQIREMVPGASVIPIHPGALKYFREAGLFRVVSQAALQSAPTIVVGGTNAMCAIATGSIGLVLSRKFWRRPKVVHQSGQ
jgi:hypothetical protein